MKVKVGKNGRKRKWMGGWRFLEEGTRREGWRKGKETKGNMIEVHKEWRIQKGDREGGMEVGGVRDRRGEWVQRTMGER